MTEDTLYSVGVWATRADYLPTALEPREMHALLLPGQHTNDPPPGADAPTGVTWEVGETGQFEDDDGEEKDKEDLEKEIRESLFRGGVGSSPSPKREPQSQSYRGRPLIGAWATTGQTGALVVQKPGEPGKYPPVKFSIQSPGSSSGQITPQSGSQTPNHRVDRSPSRQAETPNWSTPTNQHGNKGRLQHSQSSNERSFYKYSPEQQRATRRYDSTGSYHHWKKQSHDISDNWKIHFPRSPDDRSHSNSNGRGKNRGRGVRRGRGRGHQHTSDRDRGAGRHDSNSQYQRSKSDATTRSPMRGASSNPSQKPYSSWRTE